MKKAKSAEKKLKKRRPGYSRYFRLFPAIPALFREKALCNRHFLWYTYFCVVLPMRTAHPEGVRERGAGKRLYL